MSGQQVFISYAREDIEAARRLYRALHNAGADPWLDERRLLPGQDWKAEIAKAISTSRYFVAILSANSVNKRGFVQREMKQAFSVLEEFPASQVYLIPARLNDVTSDYSVLRRLHWVDLFPDWDEGVAKILLTMELHTGGSYDQSDEEGVAHPREKTFHMSANWLPEGLEIVGGKLRIPPSESEPLFRAWLDWLPRFEAQERPKSKSDEEALEKAFLLATIRACADVYKSVPDEEEMRRGSSIMSRKLNLFYSFARDAYLKASRKQLDLREYLFPQEAKSAKSETPGFEERRGLVRTMLRMYVSRVCDVRLDEVERFEAVMRNFPPWEDLVERTYDIDEDAVIGAFAELKKKMPSATDEELADGLTAFFIKAQHGLDDIRLAE